MKITLLVAVDLKRGIGYQNRMPWPHLPEDMQRFATLTKGHTLVCGRKTYESLPRPRYGRDKLHGRDLIVLSRDINDTKTYPSNVEVCRSASCAMMTAENRSLDELIVIGGTEVYKAFMSVATCIKMTVVRKNYTVDRYFPPMSVRHWTTHIEQHVPARQATPGQIFVTYERDR